MDELGKPSRQSIDTLLRLSSKLSGDMPLDCIPGQRIPARTCVAHSLDLQLPSAQRHVGTAISNDQVSPSSWLSSNISDVSRVLRCGKEGDD